MKKFFPDCTLFLAMILATGLLVPSTESVAAPGTISESRQALMGKTILGKVVTPSEANMLEPVCTVVLAAQHTGSELVWYEKLRDDPILDQPENLIAKGTQSFHHYCWAELQMARYYAAQTQQQKRAQLLGAYGDYTFMIAKPEFLPRGWAYLSKMYVKHAGAASLMGKDQEAMNSYLQAIKLDPSDEFAYSATADFMQKKGSKAKALEYIIEGLKHNPGSKRLKRHYTELGGKLPYPAPYVKAEPSAVPQPPAAAPVAGSIENSRPATEVPKEPVGTPGNPYCRFCP